MNRPGWLLASLLFLTCLSLRQVSAQFFGVESHNTLMPASGAMAGTSIARPQDNLSAINGNPASLSQLDGVQFTFGALVIDADINLTQSSSFPILNPVVTPFSAESNFPTTALPNIGVTQDLEMLGLPGTAGLGFFTNAGAGVDYADVPESNGASSTLVIFELVAGVGIDLTDRLSVGGSFQLGVGLADLGFVGLSRTSLDYGTRGSFGFDYDLGMDTNVGAYYQTLQQFTFEDSILLNLGGGAFSAALDFNADLPENVGIGFANNSLMDGRLLLAADVLYKNWDGTKAFGALYNDQLVVQLGAQLTSGRARYRMGYAWAENPLQDPPDVSIGGVSPPGAVAAAQFFQSQLALINEHRITGGVGVSNVRPGFDLDVFGGGMLNDSQALGGSLVEIESFWVGFGLTWRFGNCHQFRPRSSCSN